MNIMNKRSLKVWAKTAAMTQADDFPLHMNDADQKLCYTELS